MKLYWLLSVRMQHFILGFSSHQAHGCVVLVGYVVIAILAEIVFICEGSESRS